MADIKTNLKAKKKKKTTRNVEVHNSNQSEKYARILKFVIYTGSIQ